MKKRMIILWVLLACLAVYAGVSEKMDMLWQIQKQQQDAIRARALLQNIRNEIVNTNAQVQEIADSGSFNLLDSEIKTSLQKAWNISKAAESAFAADPNVVELFNWRP